MLTDTALRNLKPKSKIYKASDRDGMYVTVSPSGTVTFRYDYRLHGRRETLTLGRYGPGGISLAMARELLMEARKSVQAGISPALEKQREKRRVVAIKTFGAAMEAWLANARLADSTRAMRKHIIDRDILPVFRNRLLTEIQAEDLRALCNKVKERGAPATAVQIRDIVKQRSAQSIVTPYVVEVDNAGQVRAVGEAVTPYQPNDAQTAHHIARFITLVRSLSIDPIVVRQNWLDAYDYTTDRGAAVLNDYARSNDPFARIGRESVTVQISSVVRASDTSFNVRWTERRYVNGAAAGLERWTAVVSIVQQTPRTEERLRRNPLGIYVNGLSWSRDLDSSEGAKP
ncbi:type IV secretory pathway TrbF-like protein [Xanthomonas campestris]|uniref:conjugal transfer protein TrbF n=1 Tax=Xanthomonas sp. CFBP 8151 TaxID=3035310 RepID=UPI00141B17D3|nr:conjugal transfer protein TrbF [Xanthomonas sp. CFBP 8151]NIJ76419.1 type IV secretory pathway TrbF-like protein [Xanthomonas sp. CFBP 8151]